MEAQRTSPSFRYIVDLQSIVSLSQKNSAANAAFVVFLKTLNSAHVDTVVGEISSEVASAVDCTTCANCCKALVIAPDYRDVSRLAEANGKSTQEFKKKYMRTDFEGDLVFKQKPCPFLKKDRCSVYESRPALCRRFPYLDEPDFIGTLNRVLRNLHICPIVFNTFERLKALPRERLAGDRAGFQRPVVKSNAGRNGCV